PDERAVDVAGSLSHPSRSRQCNKRDNQQVLDHTLATLVTVKSIQQGTLSPQLVLLPVKNRTVSLIGIRSFNNGYRTTYSHSSKSDVASDHKSTGTPGKYIRLALSAGALLSHDRLTALLHFLENRPSLICFGGCPGFSGGPAQYRVAIHAP